VDLAAWTNTLAAIGVVGPEWAVMAHFGIHGDPPARAVELSVALRRLHRRVAAALAAGDADEDALRFEEDVRASLAPFLSRERVDRYFDTFAAATDYAGVRRYLERTNPRIPEESDDESRV
jgi:hypothetical protein